MLVIGDHITDKYIEGVSTRLSPEAPVPVISQMKSIFKPGGAANVVANLKALGENPLFLYNPKQKTEKTRILANGHIICRLDDEQYTPYYVNLNIDLSNHKFAVISDYGKGVIHYAQYIMQTLTEAGIKVLVDPKQSFDKYHGAWLIKANQKEFEDEIGEPFNIGSAKFHCQTLCGMYDFQYIIVTLGSRGCYVYDRHRSSEILISAAGRTVVDVTGAGDVFMAALAHYVQTLSVEEAAKKANRLAGISVGHLGTYVIKEDDLDNNKVVFTNGCFDILHPGHIQLLNESKKLGAKLIVGLNSNDSVKRLKGSNRPILHHDRRKKMLEALGIADEVIIFEEDTPYELIKQIKPDIITKGGDYATEQVVGHDLAKVVIIPTLAGYSTTGVINEIVRKS